MEALYYKKAGDQVQCVLCPHNCLIREGKTGICRVRQNEAGILQAVSYGKLSAIHMDPIEKKPLYHFHPGKNILSLGSVGCNMHCGCCQNWQISQVTTGEYGFEKTYQPGDILDMARDQSQNIGVAYTYNEPGIGYEFMIDCARLIRSAGLKNVMVSNGYIAYEPMLQLFPYMDAFNIDLKSFSDEFYRKQTGASLEPVLQTLKQIRLSGRHLEITCLVIPGLNDDETEFRSMTEWISRELGSETVLHLSRYHPMYRMNIEPTPEESLEYLYTIARENLHYVYLGNTHLAAYQDTHCSKCGGRVISRSGYSVRLISVTASGACGHCANRILNIE